MSIIEIFKKFKGYNPNLNIIDWRPYCEYNSIIVWLSSPQAIDSVELAFYYDLSRDEFVLITNAKKYDDLLKDSAD